MNYEEIYEAAFNDEIDKTAAVGTLAIGGLGGVLGGLASKPLAKGVKAGVKKGKKALEVRDIKKNLHKRINKREKAPYFRRWEIILARKMSKE